MSKMTLDNIEPGMVLSMFRRDDILKAPPGRSKLLVLRIRPDGWVEIQYEDGIYDYLTHSLLVNNWSTSKAYGTPLWKAINS